MTSGSMVGETKGAIKAMLAAARGLFEAEIEHAVHPLMGKPFINDLLPHNYNIL